MEKFKLEGIDIINNNKIPPINSVELGLYIPKQFTYSFRFIEADGGKHDNKTLKKLKKILKKHGKKWDKKRNKKIKK